MLQRHGEQIARSGDSEMTMKKVDLSLPVFFFIVGTRALLGAGIGLLAADKLGRRRRRFVGATLVTLGALTTIPAAFVLGSKLGTSRRFAAA
jgi:hypothetical protein